MKKSHAVCVEEVKRVDEFIKRDSIGFYFYFFAQRLLFYSSLLYSAITKQTKKAIKRAIFIYSFNYFRINLDSGRDPLIFVKYLMVHWFVFKIWGN